MHVGAVALAAGRGVGAMTDGAVIGTEVVGVLHVQRTPRTTHEAGVALDTTGNLRGQRTGVRSPGDVAALTIVDEAVVEVVSCATTATEVMPVHRVALGAGRGVIAMADIAVTGAQGAGMPLVQLAARSALEAGVAGITFAERFAQRAAGRRGGDVAELAVADEAVMEGVSCSATAAEVMTVLLMALTAGRGVIAMADIAVTGAESAGVLLVQHTACRATLEAGVASLAFAEGFAQRPAGNAAGDMAALTVVDEAVMEGVPGAATVTEVMAILLMALAAGRGVGTVTGVAVIGPEGICMLLVERAVRSVLEAGVAGGAFTIGFAQRATGDPGDVTQLADGNEGGMEIMPRSTWTITEVVDHLPREIGRNHLVALVAGRRIVAVTGGAVAGPELLGVLHVELAAGRSALEAGVAVRTDDKGFAQRAACDAGDMTGFAVADEGVMEAVAGAATAAEVMTILLMTLSTGRGVVAMAGVAVTGA